MEFSCGVCGRGGAWLRASYPNDELPNLLDKPPVKLPVMVRAMCEVCWQAETKERLEKASGA